MGEFKFAMKSFEMKLFTSEGLEGDQHCPRKKACILVSEIHQSLT